jgi:hypothetical protein
MLTRRLTRLITFAQGLSRQPPQALQAIVREKRYPPLLREAALRWLVHAAPLAVTRGAPFAQRRRYVRQFYEV